MPVARRPALFEFGWKCLNRNQTQNHRLVIFFDHQPSQAAGMSGLWVRVSKNAHNNWMDLGVMVIKGHSNSEAKAFLLCCIYKNVNLSLPKSLSNLIASSSQYRNRNTFPHLTLLRYNNKEAFIWNLTSRIKSVPLCVPAKTLLRYRVHQNKTDGPIDNLKTIGLHLWLSSVWVITTCSNKKVFASYKVPRMQSIDCVTGCLLFKLIPVPQ